MFQDPKHFARPEEFCPERWMPDAPQEFRHDVKACFKPFGMGTMNVSDNAPPAFPSTKTDAVSHSVLGKTWPTRSLA